VLKKELKEIESLDPVYSVNDEAELLKVLKIMVDSKAHRVMVQDQETGKLNGLITQSRLLEFIETTLHSIRERDQTLSDLNLGFKEVASVNEKNMALTAFKQMTEKVKIMAPADSKSLFFFLAGCKRVSAVAVVNNEGTLVGNISVNDLKVGKCLFISTFADRPNPVGG